MVILAGPYQGPGRDVGTLRHIREGLGKIKMGKVWSLAILNLNHFGDTMVQGASFVPNILLFEIFNWS